MQSCIKEPIYAIPMVDLRVYFQDRDQVQGKANVDSVYLYLYPEFDYKADPIIVRSGSTDLQIPLLPGNYGVLVHNSPIAPLYVSGAANFESLTLNLPQSSDGLLLPCPKVYAMRTTDNMRKITISRDEPNSLVLKPVVISKSIRFVINVEKFGDVISARATLGGVATNVNLSTLKSAGGLTFPINKFEVNGNRLTTSNMDLLGFTTGDDQEVILNLFVTSQGVDYELEQPVDLTEYIEDIVGDEIEISIFVSFNPDIRIHPVTIKQWQDGNELEVGIQ